VKLQSVSERFVFVREAGFNHMAQAAVSESAIGKMQNLRRAGFARQAFLHRAYL
jgi:hypothetical protein